MSNPRNTGDIKKELRQNEKKDKKDKKDKYKISPSQAESKLDSKISDELDKKEIEKITESIKDDRKLPTEEMLKVTTNRRRTENTIPKNSLATAMQRTPEGDLKKLPKGGPGLQDQIDAFAKEQLEKQSANKGEKKVEEKIQPSFRPGKK